MILTTVFMFCLLIVLVILGACCLGYTVYGNNQRKNDRGDVPIPEWLFFLKGSGPVEVTQSKVSQNGFTVVLEEAETETTMYSDIPYHVAIDLGSIEVMNFIFTASRQSGDIIQSVLDQGIAMSEEEKAALNQFQQRETPFISENPNCTLTCIKDGSDAPTTTIAKIMGMGPVSTDTSKYYMVFETLDGQPIMFDDSYNHITISFDNFWDWVGYYASVASVAASCGVLEEVTLGLATLGCVASIAALLKAAAKVGLKAVDSKSCSGKGGDMYTSGSCVECCHDLQSYLVNGKYVCYENDTECKKHDPNCQQANPAPCN